MLFLGIISWVFHVLMDGGGGCFSDGGGASFLSGGAPWGGVIGFGGGIRKKS